MARFIAGTVIVDGTDDEFFRDERVHREFNVQAVLDSEQPSSVIEIPDVRWGGECRVELSLTTRLVRNGKVHIEGDAKLFEGTSEHTNDLEDTKVISFTVPKGGRPVHRRIVLRNTERNGGDHAEIVLSFTNSLDERD